jgi:hypothetical protein
MVDQVITTWHRGEHAVKRCIADAFLYIINRLLLLSQLEISVTVFK